MKKEDLTKVVITVRFIARIKANKKQVTGQFPVSLQQWIKKTPEEQDAYVAQHTKNEVLTHDVIN